MAGMPTAGGDAGIGDLRYQKTVIYNLEREDLMDGVAFASPSTCVLDDCSGAATRGRSICVTLDRCADRRRQRRHGVLPLFMANAAPLHQHTAPSRTACITNMNAPGGHP